jgi:hypothetical protein
VAAAGVDPNSPTLNNAIVVSATTYDFVPTAEGYYEFVASGRPAKRGTSCRLLRGLGVWDVYGYGVVGDEIVMCRRS